MKLSLVLLTLVAKVFAQQTTTTEDFTGTAIRTTFVYVPSSSSLLPGSSSSSSLLPGSSSSSSLLPGSSSSSSLLPGSSSSSSLLPGSSSSSLLPGSSSAPYANSSTFTTEGSTTGTLLPGYTGIEATFSPTFALTSPSTSTLSSTSTSETSTLASSSPVFSSTSLSTTLDTVTTSSTSSYTTESSSTSSTSTSSSVSAESTGLTEIEAALLERHNYYRRLHGVPEFTWNTDLVNYAKSYIEELSSTSTSACSGTLVHSKRTGKDYGENLAYGSISATQAVDLWYEEIRYYNFEDPASVDDIFEQWGHFTQLVWKSSNQLGCVVQQCSPSRIYLICEYHPQGNVYVYGSDEYLLFKRNVFAPLT